jgi:hypothetical protein
MAFEDIARSRIAGTEEGPTGGEKVKRKEGNPKTPGVLGGVLFFMPQQLRPGQQVSGSPPVQHNISEGERAGGRHPPPVTSGDNQSPRTPAEIRPCRRGHGKAQESGAVDHVRRLPQALGHSQGLGHTQVLGRSQGLSGTRNRPRCHEAMLAGRSIRLEGSGRRIFRYALTWSLNELKFEGIHP